MLGFASRLCTSLVVALFLNFFLINYAFSSENTVLVEWHFPNSPDDAIADGGITVNESKEIVSIGTNPAQFSFNGVSTKSARSTGWHDGAEQKYWQIEFETTGYENITISSKQRSSSKGPRDFALQYKVGNEEVWKMIPGGSISVADNWTEGFVTTLALPADTTNKTVVYVRWLLVNNDAVEEGTPIASTGASNIDDVIIRGTALTTAQAGGGEGQNEVVVVEEEVPLEEGGAHEEEAIQEEVNDSGEVAGQDPNEELEEVQEEVGEEEGIGEETVSEENEGVHQTDDPNEIEEQEESAPEEVADQDRAEELDEEQEETTQEEVTEEEITEEESDSAENEQAHHTDDLLESEDAVDREEQKDENQDADELEKADVITSDFLRHKDILRRSGGGGTIKRKVPAPKVFFANVIKNKTNQLHTPQKELNPPAIVTPKSLIEYFIYIGIIPQEKRLRALQIVAAQR